MYNPESVGHAEKTPSHTDDSYLTEEDLWDVDGPEEIGHPETPYDQGEVDYLVLPTDESEPSARYITVRGFDRQKQWEHERKLLAGYVADALGPTWIVHERQNYGLETTREKNEPVVLPPDFEATMDRVMLEWKIDRLHELLAEHAESFDNLAARLAPFIMAGEVQAIVSDDVVGRIPSEYVAILANLWADDHDLPHPPLLSVAGGTAKGESVDAGGASSENTDFGASRDWAATKDQSLDRRLAQSDFDGLQSVLVVTEFTMYGDSLERMCRAFARHGIHADIAILESSGSGQSFARRMADLQPRVFIGLENSQQEALYNMIVRQATGVMRVPGEAVAVLSPRHIPSYWPLNASSCKPWPMKHIKNILPKPLMKQYSVCPQRNCCWRRTSILRLQSHLSINGSKLL